MKVVMFLCISLCFLLLRSGEYTHYRKHHDHSVYAPAQDQKQILRQLVASGPASGSILRGSTIPPGHHEVFSTEEDEDFLFSRKYVLLASFFFTLACAFLFSDPGRSLHLFFSHRRFFAAGTSIYLTQRSLRI
ncbi:hypothetical protein C7T94_06045 [Pedobacter yulinensis]|uniref:Uncharacterized protein n=1 Tax=Pedobacter yulinensis TaxID=2126353 RepID=A0A2T3HP93_9SPHI|nr:hypothetical protein [Pedobacter yulinensis]PST84280.1 hypothetical protein C7T94_06045 [Pedobacter yulinensis]